MSVHKYTSMRPAKTERGRGPGSIAPVNSLVIHSACIGGMIAPRFNDFLAQTRQNLDPDEGVIFIYDGAPAHRNPAIPAANTELGMLLAYSQSAGNRLTQGSNKKTRIEARNAGPNGRQSGDQTPRNLVRRNGNPIATRCSLALHRCFNCC